MALKTLSTDAVADAELEIAHGARGCLAFNAVMSACSNLLPENPQTVRCLRRPGVIVCLQLLGILLADREPFRHSTTMVEKAGQRLRNVEKKSTEMAAKVEQARKALAPAEQNRDANQNAVAEARSHFHETQQEHFARFPSGCPLDNDVCAGQGAVPAATASSKDAGADVVMGEVDSVATELREDANQETKDLWQQHRELEKKMQQLR